MRSMVINVIPPPPRSQRQMQKNRPEGLLPYACAARLAANAPTKKAKNRYCAFWWVMFLLSLATLVSILLVMWVNRQCRGNSAVIMAVDASVRLKGGNSRNNCGLAGVLRHRSGRLNHRPAEHHSTLALHDKGKPITEVNGPSEVR